MNDFVTANLLVLAIVLQYAVETLGFVICSTFNLVHAEPI